MDAQPELIPGSRVEPPDCYDDVVSMIEAAISNNAGHVLLWDDSKLAQDIRDNTPVEAEIPDIERAIRIYRERNQ